MPPKTNNKIVQVSPKKNEDECGSCQVQLDEQSSALSCDSFDKWLCTECIGISKSEYALFLKMKGSLTCEWFYLVCKVEDLQVLKKNYGKFISEITGQ